MNNFCFFLCLFINLSTRFWLFNKKKFPHEILSDKNPLICFIFFFLLIFCKFHQVFHYFRLQTYNFNRFLNSKTKIVCQINCCPVKVLTAGISLVSLAKKHFSCLLKISLCKIFFSWLENFWKSEWNILVRLWPNLSENVLEDR